MTDIQITDVTNGSVQTDPSSGSQTWLGTGVFDKLVEAVNKNIELQYMEGRITGSDYANVYLGSMQAVLAQATQFVLQEKVTEAQIADINAGLLLKQQQLVNMQDELATAAKQRLVMDKDIEFKDEQIESLNIEDVIKQAKHEDDLLTSGLQRQQITAQTNEITDSTVRANTQLTDALLTSGEQRIGMQKDNEVKTEQVLMSVFEREFIQPKNLEKINSDIVLTSAQITGIQKDNEVKSEQVLMSAFEREFIQPKNLEKIIKDIDVAERQITEAELTGTKQRVLLDEEKETADLQQLLLATEEEIKQYEHNVLQLDQHNANLKQETLLSKQAEELDERIDLLQTQDLGELYKVNSLMPAELSQLTTQTAEIADGTTRANVQLQDQIATNVKQRESIEKDIEIKERSTVIQEQQNTLQLVLMNEEIETANKQQVLLDTEEAAKQYEVDNILPANLASINKDVEVKERSTVVQETQLSDQLVTSAAQRDQIQKQTLNLENDDLLTLAQIGKTKAETDVTVTLAAKDVDLKEAQLEQATAETLLVKQKYVGRKQV
jgi:hypothetical protein